MKGAMTKPRLLLAVLMCASAAWGANFGRIVPLVGGASDIVLDEARGQIYLTQSLQNLVQVYSLKRQAFLSPIAVDQTPVGAALSRDGKSLYVTCYDGRSLNVVDLTSLSVSARISLPAQPEGVAVGKDGRVLVSTIGSGAGSAANVLVLYDPSPTAAVALDAITVTPPAPTPPTFPPPSGRPFLAGHSQLAATRDGSMIAGINVSGTGTPTLFVYETASATVLRARIVAGSSTTLSVSNDGSRILCGPNLFDARTLEVLAQQNVANAPYPLDPTVNFNLQSNQGGGAFSPDGSVLYSAFDISPVQIPAAPANSSQLMLNDPDNLLIQMGIQLPENLSGKMVVSSDGANAYALSDSGFIALPVGSISQSPLAVPSPQAVLLTWDQCGVTQGRSATVIIGNAGKGQLTATAQLLRYTGQANQSNAATAPSATASRNAAGSPQITFGFNSAATRPLGTIVPPHDFLIQSPEAINIPNRVRVFENSRDAEARGTIIPIPAGPTVTQTLPDLIFDSARQRLYIANAGFNRVEVYDTRQQRLLAPIKVGQLPTSMALSPDGNTLYVANFGGENVTVVDPELMQAIGHLSFPPIPFNSNLALAKPAVIAAGVSGPMILTSDGTLWSVEGSMATPRGVSKLLGQTAAGLPVRMPVPSSLAATPGGEYILLAANTGMVYLYDSLADDWVAGRQLFTATQTGYIGPVAAGAGGQYFVVNGTAVNLQLVPAGGRAAGLASAVAAAGNSNFAVFSPPSAGTGVPAVQILDVKSGAVALQANALEGPLTQVTTGRGAISGRTMVIDAAGATAYAITASGLSVIPLTPVAAADVPQMKSAVNTISLQTAVAANGLLSIMGQNLAADATTSAPLPSFLGGVCVTLNNAPLPLFMTSSSQINAQIPPGLAAGAYPLVVRSIAKQAASQSRTVTVSRYAPTVLVDAGGQIAMTHADGRLVTKYYPAKRDETLTMYAAGLGPTTGATITAGAATPASPEALTGKVEVFFGNPLWKQAGIIVDWSGLAPGMVGIYELKLRVPGFHISGEGLPVMLRVSNVDSPTTGPVLPLVSVR